MKAVHKELIIEAREPAVTADAGADTIERTNESSDDDDLFDNLRKMRENGDSNQISENIASKSTSSATRNHKRSRSVDSDDANVRKKMQKIDEGDERNDSDDNDILSFAKKTLQQDDLPDTEDILSLIPRHDSGKF